MTLAAPISSSEEDRIDPSIYYTSLADWPPHKTLRVRLSNCLARHVPLDLRRMRNKTPMVSFTFDDAPETALTIGAYLLEQANAHATYYISTALLGRRHDLWRHIDADGIRELHRKGHEIGLHCHSHFPVGCFSAAEFALEIARGRDTLRAIDTSIPAENFAYPYGHVTFERKAQISGLVRSSRGIERGVNRKFIDAQLLRSVELCDNRLSDTELNRLLDETVTFNGWLVFCSHDVGDQHSQYGVSTRLLSRAIEGALRRGLRLAHVNEALDAAIGLAT